MSENGFGVTTSGNNAVIRREPIWGNEKIFSESNRGLIRGIIEEELEYSHKVLSKRFYRTRVRVARLSGTDDYVPVMVSELQMTNLHEGTLKGKYVRIDGQFCSRNKLGEDGRKHVDLFLLATAIDVYESREEFDDGTTENVIHLDGYIVKPPVFRETPLGKQLTDLLLVVQDTYEKSNYIPCIAWGSNAYYTRELNVGSRIKLCGRMQSRQYFKRFSPMSEAGEYRTAYEISIMKLMNV